jgi:hypothetical protein
MVQRKASIPRAPLDTIGGHFGDLALECLYLSLVQASGGMDAHMAILVLKALYSGLNPGLGTQHFRKQADFRQLLIDHYSLFRPIRKLRHVGLSPLVLPQHRLG